MTLETKAQRPTSNAGPYHWPAQGEWTYEEYTRLPDIGMRHKEIAGDLFMAPAPSPHHQQVSLSLAVALYHHTMPC